MTMDECGDGKVVQHSLMETNTEWHVGRALDHSVHVNPDAADRVMVIMVDKGLNEIRVLQR